MKTARALLLGVVGSSLMATAVHAADLPPAPAVVAPPAPPPIAAPAFDWGGAYIGVYGGWANYTPEIDAGLLAGYNFVRGRFLAGIEARGGVFVPGPFASPYIWQASLNGRLGFLIGDRFLAYGVAGLGWIFGFSTSPDYYIGGGLETALGSKMSLFVEARTFVASGPLVRVLGGVTFHPGN